MCGGRPARPIHPHVEWAIAHVREAAVTIVHLHARHADIGKQDIAAGQAFGPKSTWDASEVRVVNGEQVSDGRELLGGGRDVAAVEIEGDEHSLRADAPKQFDRVAGIADRAVHDDLTRFWVEGSENLIEHDGPVLAGPSRTLAASPEHGVNLPIGDYTRGMRITLDRREWLRLGVAGALTPLACSSAAAPFAKAKSVLLVYTSGGMSQFETWDPKPNAPVEIRGAFGTIATAVPGVRFGEHMPRIAKVADRFTVLRSMSHDDVDHGSATYVALTGQFHKQKSSNPLISPTDFPTYGAVLKRVRPARHLPYTAVHVNGPVMAPFIPAPGQTAGFLGRTCEPLVLGDVTEELSLLQGMEPRPDLPTLRLSSRTALAKQLDEAGSQLDRVADRDGLTTQALELLASPQTARAFDLEQESQRTRDRYGRNRAGQACLMGRRLVEAGVPWVTVFFNHGIRGQDKSPTITDEYGWDTHNDIFEAMRDHLLPRFDLGFSALLEDLEQRGLLDTTLIVCMGEFGRAPRVAIEKNFDGSSPGRKHWAACYSIVLAGAGIGRGAVYGASDKTGGYPSLNPVTPADLTATMFASLGVDPAGHFADATNKPTPITAGRPVTGLFS